MYFRVLSVTIALPYRILISKTVLQVDAPVKITASELAARCQVFYRKIYGFFTVYDFDEDIRMVTGVCVHNKVPLSHPGTRCYENWTNTVQLFIFIILEYVYDYPQPYIQKAK